MEYHHVLNGASSVVEWTRATSLRPWLEQIPSEVDRARFLHEYAESVGRFYPEQADGHVIFPFLRRFVVAYR